MRPAVTPRIRYAAYAAYAFAQILGHALDEAEDGGLPGLHAMPPERGRYRIGAPRATAELESRGREEGCHVAARDPVEHRQRRPPHAARDPRPPGARARRRLGARREEGRARRGRALR